MIRRLSESYRLRESMERTSRGSSASSRNKVSPATPATVTSSVTPVADFIAEERRSVVWYTGGSEDTESTILPGNEETWADSPEPPQLPVLEQLESREEIRRDLTGREHRCRTLSPSPSSSTTTSSTTFRKTQLAASCQLRRTLTETACSSRMANDGSTSSWSTKRTVWRLGRSLSWSTCAQRPVGSSTGIFRNWGSS
uniref:Uncharacterized protein n=1 Tax=Lygus hesperus TaxID=30085 RepID=A0A0K8SLU1_LYGHE